MLKNSHLVRLLEENKVEKRELTISKRRVPLVRAYLTGDNARKYVNAINRMIYFYRNFETTFEIKRGEVFVVGFQFECGNELNDSHFCAALLNSSKVSQLVTIVPLHSAKEGRELNPASEVLLGPIPGVSNEKDAVALINQTRTIDKRRLYDKAAIEHFNRFVQSNEIRDYQEFVGQHKYIYRLSEEQYRKLHKAVQDYFYNGYIKHEN